MEGQKMDGVWKDGDKLVEFIRFLLCFILLTAAKISPCVLQIII